MSTTPITVEPERPAGPDDGRFVSQLGTHASDAEPVGDDTGATYHVRAELDGTRWVVW